MKFFSYILFLFLLFVSSCCIPSSENKKIDKIPVQKEIDLLSPSGISVVGEYYVYKIELEGQDYYLIKRSGEPNFVVIPIVKSTNSNTIKDSYWDW